MGISLVRSTAGAAGTLALMLGCATGLAAQARVVLPEGTVIVVRTTSPLESSTARAGQTFGSGESSRSRRRLTANAPVSSRSTSTV